MSSADGWQANTEAGMTDTKEQTVEERAKAIASLAAKGGRTTEADFQDVVSHAIAQALRQAEQRAYERAAFTAHRQGQENIKRGVGALLSVSCIVDAIRSLKTEG